MQEPLSEDTSRRNVFKYIRHDYGKNVDLRPFLLKPVLVGFVLNDEAGPLRLSIDNLQRSHEFAFHVSETDPDKRLKGWIVDRVADSKRVVLLETDMGSMNASIVIHELAAALHDREEEKEKRLIKIGTCGGLHKGQPTGAIVVPNWALDDEGASKWNTRDPYRLKVYTAQDLTPAHPGLTFQWFEHLNSVRQKLADVARSEHTAEHPLDWWPRFCSEREVTESAIWAIDTFHGRRMHPESFDEIDQQCKMGSVALVGVDNECNSHFSACRYLDPDLAIAAGLVVSWSREQVLGIARTGISVREPWEKKRVHALETELIEQAVQFLLR